MRLARPADGAAHTNNTMQAESRLVRLDYGRSAMDEARS